MEFEKYFVINQYVPNVKRDLSRLEYRMKWEDDFKAYIKNLEKTKPVIVCGDFNVAHEEIDIKNAKSNRGNAGFTDEERAKFTDLLASGFIDTFRYYNPDKVQYSWWSYMGNARAKNVGWRLDYFIVSKDIINKVSNATIYDQVMGSDHCPVGIEIDWDLGEIWGRFQIPNLLKHNLGGNLMKEKYFEDLGLDDGEEIFKKFNINVGEILNKKDANHEKENNEKQSQNEESENN